MRFIIFIFFSLFLVGCKSTKSALNTKKDIDVGRSAIGNKNSFQTKLTKLILNKDIRFNWKEKLLNNSNTKTFIYYWREKRLTFFKNNSLDEQSRKYNIFRGGFNTIKTYFEKKLGNPTIINLQSENNKNDFIDSAKWIHHNDINVFLTLKNKKGINKNYTLKLEIFIN